MSDEGRKANGHGIVWTKFYFRDWLAEPSLRRLGPEHRGVWIDMLCLMATGESYGRLETDGKPWPTSELARCLGVAQVLLEQLLEQMERVGVFSRDERGVIFSRRMLRDMDLYHKRAKAGAKGGKAARSESEKKKPEPEPEPHFASILLKQNFEAFWKAYPRKVGKSAAEKAWAKAKGRPAIEDIIKALEAQKQSRAWTKDGGQFIPHPATWLNQGRWEDVIEDGNRPKPGGAMYDN